MLCEGCYSHPRRLAANRLRLTTCQCRYEVCASGPLATSKANTPPISESLAWGLDSRPRVGWATASKAPDDTGSEAPTGTTDGASTGASPAGHADPPPPRANLLSNSMEPSLEPSELSPAMEADAGFHCRIGLGQRPVRASGLGHIGMEDGRATDRGGAPGPRECANSDDLWKEKAEAQAKFVKAKLARHVRIIGARRKGSKREEGYIEPPVKVFSDAEDPDNLRPPELTDEQATLVAALVSATLEAPQSFDPMWRAIIGAHTDALARSCVTQERTILAFRKAWYDRVEKTLDLERLKYMYGFAGEDHLAYVRTTSRGGLRTRRGLGSMHHAGGSRVGEATLKEAPRSRERGLEPVLDNTRQVRPGTLLPLSSVRGHQIIHRQRTAYARREDGHHGQC